MNLEIERTKGEIVANRGIAAAQQAKAVEDISDAAYNRAKTMAEIKDMMQDQINKYFQLAIQLEQVRQQNMEVTAKS